MGGFAWVTLATNDSYSMGALVLAHSLRRVNTAHQLVILITPGVTEAMRTQLSAVFNVVRVVDVLDSKDADNLALLARPELGITFTKLHCWKLTEFDKCVFLDADTLVLQNCDELFEREELSASPDAGWPDCFNSGVFVYKPSNETFKALIEFALIHGSFDGGDQGLLNLFFSDWATKDIKKHLPFIYNMCSTATYSYLPAFKQFGQGVKIVHFIGAAKPWLQPFNTETGLVRTSGESSHVTQFLQFWWDLFCAHVHPSLNREMAGLAGALAAITLGSPLSPEQLALEEHVRRQDWEQGHIDYMGKDSFANIWQKICETLSSEPQGASALPEEPPAPVAPVAAPVYVSSVKISPTGPIDTSPPASYAPVSSSKIDLVDCESVKKSSLVENATPLLEPQPPLLTELVSTESNAISSAALEKSAQPKIPAPTISTGTPAEPSAFAVSLEAKTESVAETATSKTAGEPTKATPPALAPDPSVQSTVLPTEDVNIKTKIEEQVSSEPLGPLTSPTTENVQMPKTIDFSKPIATTESPALQNVSTSSKSDVLPTPLTISGDVPTSTTPLLASSEATIPVSTISSELEIAPAAVLSSPTLEKQTASTEPIIIQPSESVSSQKTPPVLKNTSGTQGVTSEGPIQILSDTSVVASPTSVNTQVDVSSVQAVKSNNDISATTVEASPCKVATTVSALPPSGTNAVQVGPLNVEQPSSDFITQIHQPSDTAVTQSTESTKQSQSQIPIQPQVPVQTQPPLQIKAPLQTQGPLQPQAPIQSISSVQTRTTDQTKGPVQPQTSVQLPGSIQIQASAQTQAPGPGTPPITQSTPTASSATARQGVTPTSTSSTTVASAEDPPIPPKRKGASKAPQGGSSQKGGKQGKGKK